MTPIRIALLIILTACLDDGVTPPASAQSSTPACEWCGAGDAPSEVSEVAVIAPADEPGEKLVIEGTVTGKGGEGVAGVLVYAYHTNEAGIYPRRGDESGNGRRHGYLRGWIRTDADGRFRFETIRPGNYPGGQAPQHVHMTVTAPGENERWIDDVMFTDDPQLTRRQIDRAEGRGGSGIVTPVRRADGSWYVRRDIDLLR